MEEKVGHCSKQILLCHLLMHGLHYQRTKKKDGSWDLYASFPSDKGRENGQIAISSDFGQSFQIQKIVTGPFAYSAIQVSKNGRKLELLYEADGYKTLRFLSIPLKELNQESNK